MKKVLMVVIAVTLAGVCSVPAMADADWDFYGSARMGTFRENEDLANGKNQSITDWFLQGNSRVGAKVKTNDNGIGGRFEYGTRVNLRLLYGTWNFGPGTILVGQDYTPIAYWASRQVWKNDNALIGAGRPYDVRHPQIKLKMGGFQLALIEPNTVIPAGYKSTATVDQVVVNGATFDVVTTTPQVLGSVETTFPKIAAAYKFKTDMFYVDGYAGYNTFVIESNFGRDETFNSGLIGVNFGVIPPGPFYFKGNVFYAMNPLEYGLSHLGSGINVNVAFDAAGNTTVDDVKSWGVLGVIGFSVNDMLSLETGWGMTEYELDASGAQSSTDMSYYANAVIKLAPGFSIVPEIGMVDREDIGTNDNDIFYFGAKWQINF
jgi:hypothetical protein